MRALRLAITTSLLLAIGSTADAAAVVTLAGRPFGVGRITVPLVPSGEDLIIETNGYTLTEENGRVFYPAFVHRRALGLFRELIGMEPTTGPSSLTVFFLFKGDDPLQLTLRTPKPQTIVSVPRYSPRQFLRMQQTWWRQYAAVTRLQEREGDYPPIVEMYLARMLGQRLDLRSPLLDRVGGRRSPQKESLSLVLNSESMRLQAFDDTLRSNVDRGVADQPIPEPIQWLSGDAPTVPDDVMIEPIAQHVPEECFYARFSSYDNYLWARKFTEQNGGSASRLITLRGHDAMLNRRVQDQLGLKETALAELLGNQFISDVVLLGRDTYVREGAAIGIMFEARNRLLKGELMKQRREAAEKWESAGATTVAIKVGDHDVSFASTPGNEFRSFYAVDDRYHLVTNSLTLVQRFFEAGRGIRSLGQSHDFRVARNSFPINDDDVLFAFISPAFFRELMSPQYQIELRRRLRAAADLEIVSLARLAAIHEQLPHERVDDLVEAGLLPATFNQRPDGSLAVLSDGKESDSLRGDRGSFLPIPDVPITGVTVDEKKMFAEVSSFHEDRWPEMDPLVLQVRRTPIAGTDRERIDIRAEMLPFERKKYGLVTSVIGPPSPTRIRQSPDDAITVQIMFQGGLLRPQMEPHHLFLGIRDEEVPIEFSEISLVRIVQVLRSAPAYFGAWPQLGLLDFLPLRTSPEPDENGLARLPFGLWQLMTPDGFSLVGVKPSILSKAAEDLSVEQDEVLAQIRVNVIDVSQSKIKNWFAAMDFQRAYKTSVGNTRLLHTVSQQLGVPGDELRDVTEEVLGVKLICALGGEYQVYETPDGSSYWGSTHWPSLKEETEDGGQFASPLMAWFRGMKAQVKLRDDRMSARITLEVQALEGGKLKLPFFDLLRGKLPASDSSDHAG